MADPDFKNRPTPGVYVSQISASPPSAAGVETAVPAFIGYTERAEIAGVPARNVAVRIASMLDYEQYFGRGILENLWARGGLMGATPREAFSVNCGLGTTMSAQEVLEGYMVVQVLVQMIHPAEFIELTFKQKMEATG